MDSDDLAVRYLFETNIVPTKEETARIRSLWNKDIEELQPLETQIIQLQDTLQLLMREYEERRARIRAKEGIMSAIRRIPPEIVGQIFLRCLGRDNDQYMEDYPQSDFPPVSWFGPLVLTHICSGWRQVALTLPQLWSHIIVDFDEMHRLRRSRTHSSPSSLQIAEFARFWISCGSKIPLTVFFTCRNLLGYKPDIAHIVMDPANRYKDIEMRCPEQAIVDCLHLMSGSFGDLESMDLYGVSEALDPPPQWTHSLPIFHSSPKLRRLSILNLTPRIFSIFARSWSQLTELSLSFKSFGRRELYFTPSRCHAILRHCPNLVGLQAYMVAEPSNVTNAQLPTTVMRHMRMLENLYVYPSNGYCSLDPFYTPLVLPALKELHVRGHGTQSLVDLITRSSCKVEKLQCSPRQDPEELFAHVPFLIELIIDAEFFDERTLQSISHSELVPRLEILRVLTPNGMSSAQTKSLCEAIFETVRSRWWPGSTSSKSLNGTMVSRLKRVVFPFDMDRICASAPSAQPLVKLLNQCKREGLEIKHCPSLDDDREDDNNEDEDMDTNEDREG